MKNIEVANGLSEARKKEAGVLFENLIHLMDQLREHCPWDKKQTYQTLRSLTIEELYELVDALQNKNEKNIKEELGDLLLHILFYSKIGHENGTFDIADVVQAISTKLVNRHQHIFGDVQVENEADVKKNWETIKLKEGKKSILEGVPNALPAITKAMRMQEKAKAVGFDWDNRTQVWDKLMEEMNELKVEIAHTNKSKMEDELGDVFFALINYSRFIDIDPEAALDSTNRKFKRRFMAMEQKIYAQNKTMQSMNLKEMDEIWDEIKKTEKQ